jgi:viroplasmin and RNaseH domain-containing protein
MYPDDKYKKDKLVETAETATENPIEGLTPDMSREECIGMIGQEKFDRYTEMFGNEAASLKRCTLLKSMQKS